MPCPSSGCFVMTKSVRQHKIITGGKLQKSESSPICVIIADTVGSSLSQLPWPWSVSAVRTLKEENHQLVLASSLSARWFSPSVCVVGWDPSRVWPDSASGHSVDYQTTTSAANLKLMNSLITKPSEVKFMTCTMTVAICPKTDYFRINAVKLAALNRLCSGKW